MFLITAITIYCTAGSMLLISLFIYDYQPSNFKLEKKNHSSTSIIGQLKNEDMSWIRTTPNTETSPESPENHVDI